MLDIILSGFLKSMKDGEPICFTNTYQGIPVAHQGRILKIDKDRVHATAPRTQIITMRQTDTTYVLGKYFKQPLKARIYSWDWQDETVELGDLEFTDETIGKRSLVRVQPETPLTAVLVPDDGKRTFQALIIEISARGLAVTISRDFTNKFANKEGESIFIGYHLPGFPDPEEKTPVSSVGTIRYLTSHHNTADLRVGIETTPDIDSERVIASYLARRQTQLMKELHMMAAKEPLMGT